YRSLLLNWREAWSAAWQQGAGITLHLRSGMTIVSDPKDTAIGVFHEIFVERCYVPPWFYVPRPGHRVLDVGANIGVFSLFLNTEAPGIRIYAFEPHPETYRYLSRNLAENRLDHAVKHHQLALASGPGEVRFMIPPESDELASGHRAALSSGQGLKVEAIGLADAMEMADGGAFDLLKVDTEGAEADIILNAPMTVWENIDRVAVEFHDLTKRDQVKDRLALAGYQCQVLPTPGYEHRLGLILAWKPAAKRVRNER
ncbi:MAG TPA: FkbM family methyltransferase, partial [Isosphaeraceae bacterium]|nr:FkbM family methyltransferase [Isosphaeraceae bacterium]